MSDFDLEAFRKAKWQDREEDVLLPGLAEAGFAQGAEASDEEAKVAFRVRGLTASELARAEQEADNSKLLLDVAEKLTGAQAEKVQALVDGLGLGEATPRVLVRKISHVHMGVIDPKLKLQDVVLLADCFPIEFGMLATRIYDLTGRGRVAQVKRKPSGKTPVSNPA